RRRSGSAARASAPGTARGSPGSSERASCPSLCGPGLALGLGVERVGQLLLVLREQRLDVLVAEGQQAELEVAPDRRPLGVVATPGPGELHAPVLGHLLVGPGRVLGRRAALALLQVEEVLGGGDLDQGRSQAASDLELREAVVNEVLEELPALVLALAVLGQ